MNVHFLYDQGNADGTKGGAELTMEGFAKAAPDNVEFTDLENAETVVVGNCVTVGPNVTEKLAGKTVWRYHHDLARHESDLLRLWLADNAEHIFTSPLHREKYEGYDDAYLIPPALDLGRFRPNREQRRHGKRSGIVTIASWQNPGKGGRAVSEMLAAQNLHADCYGPGFFAPRGPHITDHGEITQEDLPGVLQAAEQFVFLPVAVEPFGRCVVEASVAGCGVITNNLVGAKYWLEEEPDKLETAGEDFWRLVA